MNFFQQKIFIKGLNILLIVLLFLKREVFYEIISKK